MSNLSMSLTFFLYKYSVLDKHWSGFKIKQNPFDNCNII